MVMLVVVRKLLLKSLEPRNARLEMGNDSMGVLEMMCGTGNGAIDCVLNTGGCL